VRDERSESADHGGLRVDLKEARVGVVVGAQPDLGGAAWDEAFWEPFLVGPRGEFPDAINDVREAFLGVVESEQFECELVLA
jgi:hypothetical protein